MKESNVVLTAVLFAGLFLTAAAAEPPCDTAGVCKLPGSVAENGVYKVLSPVGESSVRPIRQAPRLKTLSGKTVAIVGGSFMAYVTHPELKRLILRDFPDAKVLVLKEIGSAGPWPGPGVVRQQKDEFVRNLKKFHVDAVISGNGGCGLCTPKEMGSCIAAEHAGIPAVMIAAPGFADQAAFAARTAGVFQPYVAVYPGAFSAHSREELLENTRKVLYPRIVAALTGGEKPYGAEKSRKSSGDTVFSGSLDEVGHFFLQNSWSDGLPIIPPTPERVAQFLKFTDLDPDSVIAAVPPSYRKVTPRLVAVNGVMAGCPPEFMPLLIAFAKSMCDGDFRRTLASTHAWTPYVWVNGPVGRQLGFDCGQGEITSPRNAKLGRFINLAMLNLGGYYTKLNRMGTFGYLMPWALAEDEEAALKLRWLPWHMQMGYGLNENTLTSGSALNWGNNLAPATPDPVKIMELMAQDAVEKQQFALGSGTPFVWRVMLVTSFVARDLARKYPTKNALEDALVAAARMPIMSRTYANYFANPGSAFDPRTYDVRKHAFKISAAEEGRITPTPPWLAWVDRARMETVPVMKTGKTAILVTGDANRNKTMCVPGGGFTTVRIELPRNWDKLMAERGYAPLNSFYLRSDLKPAAPVRLFRSYRPRGRFGQ